MIWYKINQKWWINMTQVRAFGKSKDSSDVIIIIQWKSGSEEYFSVDDADKELAKLEKFVQQMFEPIKVITPDDRELPFGMN